MAYETRKLYVLRRDSDGKFLDRYASFDVFKKARIFTLRNHAAPKIGECGPGHTLVEVTATIEPQF